ncbi:hypothetical protein ACFQ3P_04995 [Paraburkholderia sabiae]|uniref:Uncharacterized protein n=1 Tax=Paraburkholderia sabiae TaxID=273251 RepID=A0ABU9QEN7_9BURK|nr:hypothetical protein [Paraburkholderia sabiae]WJZ76816.1 hypothetical protein QEN71_13780 [Paraburkholderia sabiae]CAD6546772.1 hypothetical protein LMG24235_04353 [Paraburkholderia sabiae]
MSYGIVSRIVTFGAILLLASCGGGGGGSSTSPGSPSASSGEPVLANATALVDGSKVGDDYWPAGSTQTGGTGAPVSGLNCGTRGNLYTYSHLSIYLNGRPLALPTNIGTVGPTMAAQTGCAYPVHTDDESGKIRMDASTGASYTLGQFFAVWGQTLTSSNVAGLTGMPITIYVNNGGQLSKYTGDPASLVLPPHGEVSIQIGSSLGQIPTFKWTDPPSFDPNQTVLTFGGVVGTAHWADGNTSTGGTGADVDGLVCASGMSEAYHVHAHLAIINNGQWLALPKNVGILSQCNYEMHTHDQTGIIHIETPSVKNFTLGQFFDIWGQTLSRTNVAGVTGTVVAYINDNGDVRRYEGELRDIPLTSHRDITLQVGTPVSTLATYNWYEPQ